MHVMAYCMVEKKQYHFETSFPAFPVRFWFQNDTVFFPPYSIGATGHFDATESIPRLFRVTESIPAQYAFHRGGR